MSQQPTFEQNVMVYSDEASMANGSNGESTLWVVNLHGIEEPEMGVVPQTKAQPVAPLFGGQRIFEYPVVPLACPRCCGS